MAPLLTLLCPLSFRTLGTFGNGRAAMIPEGNCGTSAFGFSWLRTPAKRFAVTSCTHSIGQRFQGLTCPPGRQGATPFSSLIPSLSMVPSIRMLANRAGKWSMACSAISWTSHRFLNGFRPCALPARPKGRPERSKRYARTSWNKGRRMDAMLTPSTACGIWCTLALTMISFWPPSRNCFKSKGVSQAPKR